MMPIDAIIVAAGRGTRLGGPVPKQYLPLGARTVLARAVDAFLGHPAIRSVVVVIAAGDERRVDEALADRTRAVRVVTGGATRQASVARGLAALGGTAPPSAVMVHDAARPFVSAGVIDRVAAALTEAAAVVPAVPIADTVKRVDGGRVIETVDRSALVQVQTPQGFHLAALLAAHAAAGTTETGSTEAGATDDAGLIEAQGGRVTTVPGERTNFKITTEDDLAAARASLAAVPVVGHGFDVHRLEPGGPMVIGGLTIESPTRMKGHSDADVALHAITDALFGAIADGDIGHHFPPSDETWRGAASDRFLAFAAERVRARGGRIAHIDLTIMCERPKIGPLREAMRARIAEIVAVPVAAVSVKATTTERLGFTGRGEGIAAQATATVLRETT
ncbi:bifunctional 2-C-methyl-D-erythritol 4-phosphate cytidylyltransferase/2-C-methyl-D-erythritol 2,4-cyclodiphosphate synthase [Acuticoccus sp. I52.16.1]|uniref:bifunctional 2-C-methyl-D-erythritol 4-phosphate cytidylyltransferase/2-C-methyl-D-erythritol 2,4-cyclodiphosphate synthase n=1 Tax=Acuticoccus sp. I52.16.1 TaxID=2928472 RepID=UPI001FD45FAC|nr:bifunctional 2-C-methyl-D-erythritol 4-phosphate cytidylyltransferase/2-C-methyl-D-erythritol 2,4-cyclodiphosphate synthase [Acuticoccus sp. I52.16.1]UOM35216.1 bifunctional 2-C-methyl-D-erythritol 4-phosphate cytidylyltransferase/2-C-methyl-D-erythritol 2,4-cyclodiphosphate synthase [Acuticoccus sp. I52.16.1]